jgi:murein DD-endopeptidase MepM/ murein hydrolase activator NlpD
MPDEHPDDWMRHIVPILDPWVSAGIPPGALIVVPGNEPDIAGVDVPVPWEIAAWFADAHSYRDALRARYPRLPILAPPLTSINTPEITADYLGGYEAAATHNYWAEGNPGWRQGRDGGAAWRCATDLGIPCYVTELNSNPTSTNEILAWASEVDSALMLGACLFLPDAAGTQFAMYDVTVAEAAAVKEGLVAQPVPPTPDPPSPPTPAPTGYTGDSVPLGNAALHPDWYTHAPKEVADAYATYSPVIGYDPNLAIAQSAIETGRWTSPAYINRRNMAGVGITGNNVLGPTWDTVAQGVQAHLALLDCYYGSPPATDPWGQLTRFGFGGFTLGLHTLKDMNGKWAVPGTVYGQSIAATANEVTGGVVPAPGPTPQPTPAQHYQIVTPVDCPVAQGSDGAFSHGGRVPGFYAMDYGCVRGTPCRASADGTVGVIYTTDWNPISARTGTSIWIDHDEGHSTFSCHMSRIDVATGGRVTQGQIIGLTGDPAIDGGFGDGAHLHWEIWNTAQHVRVKMEDLEAAGIAGPWSGAPALEVDVIVDGHLDAGSIERLWYGNATQTAKKKMAYNAGSGIGQRWKKELLAGHPLGAVQSGEEADTASGRVLQFFTNGMIAYYTADGSTTVN